MRKHTGKILLASSCALSVGIYYYVKTSKYSDYKKRYEGVLNDIERQKKKFKKWTSENL
ncbi:conserved Plasmodium protein, unknown function [Plasmodium reichenowi]|uniref:Protein PET117, putative n=11 Tax=Plasmodium (Laverania) TaxID=418107 RepID=Q8IKQ0_PLAF7|nr:protein PET117, putative [Plasmodium falciparum 3D7]XP_012765624.1 hypothetical protein PRSY57_1457400 [Plasmodium reichenowi]ETW15882.1 hypothetical protein PFFVO_05213 [Plasmodium falciparum Vietnam Oak-Knoll (FVO)]ETW39669.1 hypothetical protein PFNF135_05698 [Plasmodium falciparum NF135/5.C10]ETW58559.1 hypothetical protein PFMC_05657 [Plasmodium falciparum CAMP/Malaysia]EUR62434.1 hypothetical protein PFBG_05645 [Plasmodium falciparum 7G8]EUT79106.1 hypothetical protein PFAG_05678 [Pl|eukprot:XP_001348728.1 protein PET117, putative [Plasmodium falciparum 3D7]